jgi:hypothetical protein
MCLIAQGDLAWAPRPLIRAGIDSLLARRQQYAAAVESGLPLPPLRQICGVGMIRATASGHLMVSGCTGPLEVDGGLPDWRTSVLQRQGSAELALRFSRLTEEGFGTGGGCSGVRSGSADQRDSGHRRGFGTGKVVKLGNNGWRVGGS